MARVNPPQAPSAGENSGSSRFNTVLFLKHVEQFIYFFNGQFDQLICDFFNVSHFIRF